MTLIVNESGGINLTLEIGQGPPGPSTAATQAAQLAAELARDEAELAAMQAQASRNAALISEQNADISEANALASENNAQDWATKQPGLVEGIDYSSKEYAIGTTTPLGSSKQWATSSLPVADGLESAKTYAKRALDSATQTSLNTKVFATYAIAVQAVKDRLIPNGSQVLVSRDETRNSRKSIYVVDYDNPALSLNFVNNTYATHEFLIFVTYILPDFFETPPATSTSLGFLGAFAVDSDFLYVGIGDNQWKRISLTSF